MASEFKFKAIDSTSGEVIEGVLKGVDEESILSDLHLQGHIPVSVKAAKKSFSFDELNKDILSSSTIRTKDIASISKQICVLLKAGVSLEKSLEIAISAQQSKPARSLLKKLLGALREGQSLTQACESQGDKLPILFVNMIRAGEESAALPNAFERLSDYYEHRQKMSEKIRSSLIYPIILLITSGLSVIFLITFVLPQFQPMFENSGKELPWLSRYLINIGDFVSSFWWILLSVLTVAIALIRYLAKKPENRRKIDHTLRKLPVFGNVITALEVSHLCNTLGMLITNGTPLRRALVISMKSSDNAITRAWLEEAEIRIREGERLSEALRKQGLPNTVHHLISIGEETGKLGEMLGHVTSIFEENALQNTQRLLTLLSPALTIILGGLVAIIVGSLLTTVMEINEFAF